MVFIPALLFCFSPDELVLIAFIVHSSKMVLLKELVKPLLMSNPFAKVSLNNFQFISFILVNEIREYVEGL